MKKAERLKLKFKAKLQVGYWKSNFEIHPTFSLQYINKSTNQQINKSTNQQINKYQPSPLSAPSLRTQRLGINNERKNLGKPSAIRNQLNLLQNFCNSVHESSVLLHSILPFPVKIRLLECDRLN